MPVVENIFIIFNFFYQIDTHTSTKQADKKDMKLVCGTSKKEKYNNIKRVMCETEMQEKIQRTSWDFIKYCENCDTVEPFT